MASPTEIFLPDTLPFPIKVHSLPARAGASVKPGHRLLTYSFLHIPPGNVKESETRYGSWDATFDGDIKSWNVKIGDMITRQRARDKAVLNIIEPCKHGVQFNGLCALCGMDMDNFDYTGRPESSRATIQMTHSASGPTVSLEEAQKLERDTAEHLLASRKLSLIVDLDQTIVHATVDPTVGEWISEGEAWEERQARREARKNKAKEGVKEEGSDDSSDSDDDDEEDEEVNPNWEALKDVKKFRLAPDTFSAPRPRWQDKGKQKGIQNEGCLYYVKPRPGWQEFLPSVAKKYEMHVYTMGTRAYAEEVCAAIDPDGTLFGGRILSRDESGSLTQKSLRRLFPCDTSMVVIIDDRADVWEWSPNLLKVIPYDFFVGIGDINSTFLPKQVDLLKDVPTEQKLPLVDAKDSATLSSPPIPVPSSPELSSNLSDTSDTTAAEDSDEKQSVVKTEMITQNTLALEAQLEERPLAKKQELLEEDKEEEETPLDASVESNSNGVPSDAPDQGKSKHHRKALLKNDDTELTRIGQLLDEVHRKFFEAYDNRLPENKLSKRRQSVVRREVPYDVKLIIPKIRVETFKDIHILFSGVIPTNTPIVHESTEIWRMARAFGATCHKDMVDAVTHVVTSKRGTQKVEKARSRGGIFVVWIQWFQDSVARWKRQDERLYLVDDEPHSTTPQPESASSPPSDPNAISTDTDPEELVGENEGDGEAEAGEINEDELSKELLAAVGATEETSKSQGDTSGAPSEVTDLTPEDLDLGDVDWQNVNDEVDAAMMESDSDDDDRRSVVSASGRSSNADEEESDLAMEDAENLPSLPSTPRGKRKRLRSLTPSEFNNRRDALRSPLAKRKKLAADRSGMSPLKETVLANDISSKAENDENEDMGDSRPATPTRAQDSTLNEDEEYEEDTDSSEGEEFDDDFLARELAEELG